MYFLFEVANNFSKDLNITLYYLKLGEIMTTNINITVNEYTNRVLGVIKEKFGLNDKGEALNKFADLYGAEYVEPELKEEMIRDILRMDDEYVKKHPKGKAITLKELDALTGAK